jgi:hypothetical protein
MPKIEAEYTKGYFDEPWKQTSFRNLETGVHYRLLAGGFVFPGRKPGFGVIVGVDLLDDPALKIPQIHCLGEIEESGSQQLISKCLDLRNEYLAWDWFSDPKTTLNRFLDPVNQDLREKNEMDFYPLQPPYFEREDCFSYYMRILEGELKSVQKTLFLGNCTRLKGYVGDFPEDGAVMGTRAEYPALAALGFVVASVREYKPWESHGAKEGYQGPIQTPLGLEW